MIFWKESDSRTETSVSPTTGLPSTADEYARHSLMHYLAKGLAEWRQEERETRQFEKTLKRLQVTHKDVMARARQEWADGVEEIRRLLVIHDTHFLSAVFGD